MRLTSWDEYTSLFKNQWNSDTIQERCRSVNQGGTMFSKDGVTSNMLWKAYFSVFPILADVNDPVPEGFSAQRP